MDPDPFYVSKINEDLLHRIVKKFDGRSGGAFYRSCRLAKNVVERVKPVWPLMESLIIYRYVEEIRSKYAKMSAVQPRRMTGGLTATSRDSCGPLHAPLEFCRVETVRPGNLKNSAFFKNFVLPDLRRFGGVGELTLSDDLSDEDVRQLLAAARPNTLKTWDEAYDPLSDVFKDLKAISLHVKEDYGCNYWKKIIFELAANKRNITLGIGYFHEEGFADFLKIWLMGKSTGLLQTLTVQLYSTCLKRIVAILQKENIQKHVKSSVKNVKTTEDEDEEDEEEDEEEWIKRMEKDEEERIKRMEEEKNKKEYIIEREGLDRLHITVTYSEDDGDSIHFHFS